MRIIKFLTFAVIASATVTSCISDEKGLNSNSENASKAVEARFTASNTATLETRVGSDGKWELTDTIGIFDKSKTGVRAIGYIANTNETTSSFVHIGSETFTYENDDSPINFCAYFPYDPNILYSSDTLALNFRDQTSAVKYLRSDFMYASEVTGQKSSPDVTLNFTHKMSKLILNITNSTGTDLSGMTVSVHGLKAMAGVVITSGSVMPKSTAPVEEIKTYGVTAGSRYEVILIPQAAAGGSVKFTVGADVYTWTIPSSITFTAGYRYTYAITILKNTTIGSEGAIEQWNDAQGTGQATE